MKVKFLVLLSAIAIVTAVPFKPKQKSSNEVYKKMMMQQLKWKLMISRDQLPRELDFEDESVTEIEELNTSSFRLPNNTVPLHYDLVFTTNVHAADFSFRSETSILIRVLEPTNTITLHASQLIIERINLFTVQGDIVQFNMNFRTNSVTQFLEISVDRELQVGQEFELFIESFGVLRTNRLGFYRTSHVNRETSQTNWVASTLFEPTHARSAFPCYDEIRYRTAFDITIIHHQSYNALSNMPVKTTSNAGSSVTTRFQTTPTMPTYNVAFTVSNYDSISNNNAVLPMKVFAQPAQIAAGRADAALELSERMWTELNKIFKVPYPLPKCDIVAVNNWRNGEAWGLLKIDDWDVLGGQDLVSDRSRRVQIAHEISVRVLYLNKPETLNDKI